LNSKINNLWNDFKTILRNTSIEVYIGMFLGLATSGFYLVKTELDRKKQIPLVFSEISQIEKDAAKDGVELTPLNLYLPKTSDALMKIFECWDDSHKRAFFDYNIHLFASELEERIDITGKRWHYNLKDLASEIPEFASKSLKQLEPFVDVMNRSAQVNESFDEAWRDFHNDVNRTETYTDSDGKTQTREVYDHTNHDYYYYKKHGEAASRSLDVMLDAHPSLKFQTKLRTTSETHADGEYAAESSRDGLEKKGEMANLDADEFMNLANSWFTGSTLNNNLPKIYAAWKLLHSDADSWRHAKNHSRSHHYRTYARSDSGPKEFQVAEEALHNGIVLHNSIAEFVDAIQYTRDQMPILYQKVEELIGIELDNEPGNSKKVARDLMKIAKTTYKMNFSEGVDVDRFRMGVVALGMLASAVVGGLVGFGFHKAGDHFNWWRQKTVDYTKNDSRYNKYW